MVTAVIGRTPAEEVIRLQDQASGLDGVLVIHSTALGAGAGGCRFWNYDNFDSAAYDAMRLAEGMSYKNAMAGLPFGGAKAVLRRPKGSYDRSALFRAFGRAVEDIKGRYVTAEDVGTCVADMQDVARETAHVAGLAKLGSKAGGDPSPTTARGVFDAIRAAASFTLETDLRGTRVAVQGLGNVGAEVCRLLADAGAQLIVADSDAARRAVCEKAYGARVVDVADILSAEADIVVPCALGGVFTEQNLASIKAHLVCGAANNQLSDPRVAEMMMDRGITYVPDYVANAGGIISVTAEYLGESQASVDHRVAQIGPRVSHILNEARRQHIPPAHVADQMAEAIMAQASRRAA
jgi:leucine dehydrogenase